MKFLIPDIGFTLKLTSDFLLQLSNEHRNHSVIRSVPTNAKRMDDAIEDRNVSWLDSQKMVFNVMLPTETVLTVARVYIRKGASDYSSLTFNIKSTPAKHLALKKDGGEWNPKWNPRWTGRRSFWIPLDQAHEMEFEIVG